MMKRFLKTTIAAAVIAIGAIQVSGQAMYFSHARMEADTATAVLPDTTVSVCDSLLNANAVSGYDIFDMPMTLPDVFFMPAVYDRYRVFTPLSVNDAPAWSGSRISTYCSDRCTCCGTTCSTTIPTW